MPKSLLILLERRDLPPDLPQQQRGLRRSLFNGMLEWPLGQESYSEEQEAAALVGSSELH